MPLGPFLSAVKAVPQSSEKFDQFAFRKYMHKFGKAYQNQATELIAICRLFSQVAHQVFTQDAELTKVLEICDQALLKASSARKEKDDASDDDIERAIRQLEYYGVTYGLSKRIPVRERMKGAKEEDKKPRKFKKYEDPSSKVTKFHIMKNPTDPHPTIVRQVLNNNSKLEEILWNFTRFDPGRRLTLSQNPHFYNYLPTSSNASWKEFNATATQENWHTYPTEPIRVLTNIPGRMFLELRGDRRAFDNVWNADGTLIFRRVCGKLECEGGVVRAFIPHSFCSWCHVEHLASEPGTAAVRPNQSSRSNNCVSVDKWIHELRQALPWQDNLDVKIRISKCTEPTRGCGCSDSDEGRAESLEHAEGVSSLIRGEWTRGHGIVGSGEGSTKSLERPQGEGVSSPTRGERTRGNGFAGSDEGSTETFERPEGITSPTRGEWTGVGAFWPRNLNALLVCLLSFLYLYFLLLS